MDKTDLHQLLTLVQNGHCSIAEAEKQLRHLPAENIPGACIDHQRGMRTNLPEVIYGESKSATQITTIAQALLKRSGPVMATRISRDKATKIQQKLPELQYHEQARMLTANPTTLDPDDVRGNIAIICAGTSDLGVAEEARVTAETLGHPVQALHDVGVAGLHRLLAHQELLHHASVIIAVAGMEGALPSVIGGLAPCPLIGVPTSVGYGASSGGLTALLAMLNSCAPGLGVVNIDNGFGAACLAAAINRNT